MNKRNHFQELNYIVQDKIFFMNINTCSLLLISMNLEDKSVNYTIHGDKKIFIDSITELLIQRPEMLKLFEQGIDNYKKISDNINLTDE